MVKNLCGDPGHGGSDPGAMGNGVVEKDWTLNFVKLLRAKLEAKYYTRMYFARGNDSYVANGTRDDIARANKCIGFISIHINSVTDPAANGFESFKHPKASASVAHMQTTIHNEIMAYLKPYGIKDRGTKTANFQVLRENTVTSMPAILFENLFLSNPAEAKLLKDAKFVDDLADAYVRGIAKAFQLQPKAGGEYQMKPEDADKLIGILKKVYEIMPATDKALDARTEINRLANELRKASGQPTT